MKFGSGYAPSKTILIKNEKGQEYWLNFVNGKLDVGGNLPMSEAAEIFFAEVKQIAGVAMQQPTAPAGALTEDGVNRAAKALFDDRHCDSDFKDSADISQAFIECQHDARVVFKALSAYDTPGSQGGENTARVKSPGIRQVGEPSDSSAATSASRTGLPNNCEGSAPTLSKEEAVEIILEAWEMRQKKLSPLTRWLAEDAYRALLAANPLPPKSENMLPEDYQLLEEGVTEQLREEKSGYWHSCSGCYEAGEYGGNSHYYHESKLFGCMQGSGCSECGGLGVVWDNIDYEALLAATAKGGE